MLEEIMDPIFESVTELTLGFFHISEDYCQLGEKVGIHGNYMKNHMIEIERKIDENDRNIDEIDRKIDQIYEMVSQHYSKSPKTSPKSGQKGPKNGTKLVDFTSIQGNKIQLIPKIPENEFQKNSDKANVCPMESLDFGRN